MSFAEYPIAQAAVCGAAGQVIGLLVAFKKARDVGQSTRAAIAGWDGYRLLASFLLGAAAGSWSYNVSHDPWTWFSFGYMGASAIDTLATKKLP